MTSQPRRDPLALRSTKRRSAGSLSSRARAQAWTRGLQAPRGAAGIVHDSSKRGGVLVEFAFIALAFYLLLAGTLEVGRMVFALQTLQGAARVGARELAQVELPAAFTFEQALADARVRTNVYDAGKLVIDVQDMTDGAYQQLIDNLPSVNRMLVPLMIRERMDLGGGPRDYLRYPGAVMRVVNPGPGDSPFTIAIPRVLAQSSTGAETIDWVPVLEEIRPSDPLSDGPFSLVSGCRQRGLVSLRINYPYQAATLSAYRVTHNPDGSVINDPVEADDGSVVVAAAPPAGTQLASGSSDPSANSGPYGLGQHYALTRTLRPFRRLLSSQSMFRREVFTR